MKENWVFGYMIDCLQPTQVKGGRWEGKGSRYTGLMWAAIPEAHLGLSGTHSGRLTFEMNLTWEYFAWFGCKSS